MRRFKVRTQSTKTKQLTAFKESDWVQLHDQWERITIQGHPTEPDLLEIKFEDTQNIFIFNSKMLRQLLVKASEEGTDFLDFATYKQRK